MNYESIYLNAIQQCYLKNRKNNSIHSVCIVPVLVNNTEK